MPCSGFGRSFNPTGEPDPRGDCHADGFTKPRRSRGPVDGLLLAVVGVGLDPPALAPGPSLEHHGAETTSAGGGGGGGGPAPATTARRRQAWIRVSGKHRGRGDRVRPAAHGMEAEFDEVACAAILVFLQVAPGPAGRPHRGRRGWPGWASWRGRCPAGPAKLRRLPVVVSDLQVSAWRSRSGELGSDARSGWVDRIWMISLFGHDRCGWCS